MTKNNNIYTRRERVPSALRDILIIFDFVIIKFSLQKTDIDEEFFFHNIFTPLTFLLFFLTIIFTGRITTIHTKINKT